MYMTGSMITLNDVIELLQLLVSLLGLVFVIMRYDKKNKD